MINKECEEIIELIGLTRTLDLVGIMGGRIVRVPTKDELSVNEMIVLIVGMDAARLLVRRFGGHKISIPAERNVLMELRRRKIADEYVLGSSVGELANRWRMSKRQITRILSEVKDKDRRALSDQLASA